MARSVNCVHLIGNLTRDPEQRYTSTGRAVCDVGLATNRQWRTETGEQKEDTEFHRIVLWGKLAEIASQYLRKGAKAYFQGRLATRSWTAQDGTQRQTTEIVAEDMMMLSGAPDAATRKVPDTPTPPSTRPPKVKAEPGGALDQSTDPHGNTNDLDVNPDEIPF